VTDQAANTLHIHSGSISFKFQLNHQLFFGFLLISSVISG